MSNLRSAKTNIELQERSSRRSARSMSKARKVMTVVLAAFMAVAIVTWVGLLGWGGFALCRWLLSFFSA